VPVAAPFPDFGEHDLANDAADPIGKGTARRVESPELPGRFRPSLLDRIGREVGEARAALADVRGHARGVRLEQVPPSLGVPACGRPDERGFASEPAGSVMEDYCRDGRESFGEMREMHLASSTASACRGIEIAKTIVPEISIPRHAYAVPLAGTDCFLNAFKALSNSKMAVQTQLFKGSTPCFTWV